jgi:hypothetical protein
MVTGTVLKDDIVMQVVQCQMPSGKQEVSLINIDREVQENLRLKARMKSYVSFYFLMGTGVCLMVLSG